MTIDPNPADACALDRRARSAHQAAVHALSTHARLQLQRRTRLALQGARPGAERRQPRWGWIAAPALAIAGAVALQAQLPQGPGPAAAARIATESAPPADVAAPLEHDPDFYLWLASADAVALAGDP